MTTSGSYVRRLVKTARATLRDRDNLSSYPTLVRTVSDARVGDFAVKFDDRNTINFTTASVRYPVMLRPDDPRYLNSTQAREALGSTVVAGVGGGLTAVGKVVKGVSDALLTDIPGSPYANSILSSSGFAPFVEDSVSYGPRTADEWWSTGSILLDVGEGFTSPVWSKTKIEIDISPSQQTQIGMAEYANNNTDVYVSDRSSTQKPEMYPMAYFNFSSKAWEPLGTASFGGGFQVTPIDQTSNRISEWLQNTCIGFSRGREIILSGAYDACRPITTLGFPTHEKFHATSSQTLRLNNYIKHPFVLEKFVIEVDCEYTSSLVLRSSANSNLPWSPDFQRDAETIWRDNTSYASPFYATINTVFLLNQRKNHSQSINNVLLDAGAGSQFGQYAVLSSSVPTNIVLSKNGQKQRVNTTRDLISYAQLVSYSGSLSKFEGLDINDVLNLGLTREVNLDARLENNATPAGAGPWNGVTSFKRKKIQISGSVKSIVDNDAVDFINFDYQGVSLSQRGGRTGVELKSSGRDLSSAIGTQTLTSTNGVRDAATGNTFAKSKMGVFDVQNPYILLPDDELILGWQVPVSSMPIYLTSGTITLPSDASTGRPHSIVKFFPSSCKLTLYGSLLREGKEYHEPLNQPLNTSALHEALHFDNPVIDQLETATRYEYSGSYTDDYMSGSLLMYNPSTKRYVQGDRRRAFSNVNATTGVTGSLGDQENTPSRFVGERVVYQSEVANTNLSVRLTTTDERLHDTLIPDISQIVKINGSNIFLTDDAAYGGNKTAAVLNFNGAGYAAFGQRLQDFYWTSSHPFEPRYANVKKLLKLENEIICDKFSSDFSNLSDINPTVVNRFIFRFAMDPHMNWSEDGTTRKGLDNDNATKFIYGVGDWHDYSGLAGPAPGFPFSSVHRIAARNAPGRPDEFGPMPLIRGWKYGLYSGLASYTSCVFRRGRYGQLRDMLEQRLDSKFFVEKGANKGSLAAPVQVKFVNPFTGKTTSPESTWSSNLSFECTSSVPYADGEARNRPPINVSSLNQGTFNISTDSNGNLTL